MTTNQSSDLLDEDSAVLQFPKDELRMTNEERHQCFKRQECFFCGLVLEETFISCAICDDLDICPPCFSQGSESETHRNNHPYLVRTNEIPLFIHNWSAGDEVKLLDAIIECGFGNWEDIARRLVTHSAEACKSHYINYYIENRPFPELPRFKESFLSYQTTPVYKFCTADLNEPPRFASGSLGHRTLGGYNAARGDFDSEHDNKAELVLEDIDLNVIPPTDPDFELVQSLQVAIAQGYNERLRERDRRHKIVQEHGLILARKTYSWMHRFEYSLTRVTAEKLSCFMQVLSAYEFDMLYERLHNTCELRKYINHLRELHSNGINRLQMCRVFLKLKAQRSELQKYREQYLSVALNSTRNLTNVSVSTPRRSAPPLDIVGLPGYERLTTSEQELCATTRIVPESYTEFKRILQAESKKHGFLKLAQARVLIKIDVNKTRKLFDFLVKEGYIVQSLQTTKMAEDHNIVSIPLPLTDQEML